MDDNKRTSKIRKQRRSEWDGITKEHQRGSLKSGEGDDGREGKFRPCDRLEKLSRRMER